MGIELAISMARNTLEVLLEQHPELVRHYLHFWEKSQMPLLQRLVVVSVEVVYV